MADGILNDNIEAWTAIGWLLSKGKGQLYMMVASPRMQREVVSHYTYAKAKFHDCADWKDGFQVKQFLDETKSEAEDIRAHFFVEFQDVLSGSEGKDWAANLGRLNHAREMLAQLEKNLVFCVTPDAQARIRQNARDFYDFTQRIFFEDQLPKEGGKNAPPRMPDKSVGVAVELDLTRPDDELLAQANELMEDGVELHEALRYQDALTLLDNARTIREKVLTDEHPDTADIYTCIASVYRDTGNYATSLEYIQKAREIQEKVFGVYSAKTASTYNNTGFLYNGMGDYETALEWCQKAQAIGEAVLGKEHPDTAMSYNNIGDVYASMGEYQSALEWYQKARKVQEAVLGKEHPNTAATYNNIGGTYHSIGDYTTALQWHQKAREIREALLGTKYPDTAATYNNIAGVYNDLHKYPKALEYYGKAEVIWEKVYGTEHPNMAKLYNNLGTVYYYLMNFHTAEEYLLKALKIQECFLGANHPNTALTYYNLGNLYISSGKHAKALLYHNKAKQNPAFQKRLNSMVKHRASPKRKKKKKK